MISQYMLKLSLLALLWFSSQVFCVYSWYDVIFKIPFLRKMRDAMFYHEILTIFLETNLELILSSWLNLVCVNSDPDCNTLNEVISIIIAIVILLIPIVICYVLYKFKSHKNDVGFIRKWGTIIKNYRSNSMAALTYKIWYCLRRFLFISSVFQMRENSYFQIQFLFYINLAMTIYIGKTRPFIGSFRNKIELFNEFQFSLICYMTVICTDFVLTLEDQYDGGWIIIVLIINFFFLNMCVVLKSLFKIISLIVEKNYNIIAQKVKEFQERRAKEKELDEIGPMLIVGPNVVKEFEQDEENKSYVSMNQV